MGVTYLKSVHWFHFSALFLSIVHTSSLATSPTPLQMALHILSLLDTSKLSEQALNEFVNNFLHQTEIATRDYCVSIQRPSTIALSILVKMLQQLQSKTHNELVTSLLRLLHCFDFDCEFKRSVALNFLQSVLALGSNVDMNTCHRRVSSHESVQSLDKFWEDCQVDTCIILCSHLKVSGLCALLLIPYAQRSADISRYNSINRNDWTVLSFWIHNAYYCDH